MNLKDVSSNELIAELSSRDLFEEVPEELKIWMKENKFTQITKFQFYHPIETRMFYDLAFYKREIQRNNAFSTAFSWRKKHERDE